MQIRLWEMRTAKGLTLMELAKKSGIGKSTLNNIENGKVSPTLFQLETIAIALEVRITDLFESEYLSSGCLQRTCHGSDPGNLYSCTERNTGF